MAIWNRHKLRHKSSIISDGCLLGMDGCMILYICYACTCMSMSTVKGYTVYIHFFPISFLYYKVCINLPHKLNTNLEIT